MSEVRQRQRPTDTSKNGDSLSSADSKTKESTSFSISVLDIVRIVVTLIVASSALSYWITNESILWGYRPWFTRPGVVLRYFRGPLHLTPEQLSIYNGTDPNLPIYVSINHTLFDVSASRHTYGPGGSYAFFSGRDATRAFVTGCFREDLTPDIRGVEEMYLPYVDPADADVVAAEEKLTAAEKKLRREREVREAKKQVKKQVQHWEGFFRNSKKYFEVGRLVVDEELGPPKELCEAARQKKPKRKLKDYKG